MYASDDTAMHLGGFLAVLPRRGWLVAAVVVLTVGSAAALAMSQVPEDQAQAEVAVEPFQQSEDASLQEVLLGELTVNTERRILTSRAVTDRVIEATGVSTTADELLEQVTVVAVPDTRVPELRVVDTDPELVAEIANAYVNSYLDFRRDQAIDSLVAAQQNLTERRENLQQQLDRVQQQLDDLAEPEPVIDPDNGLPTGEVDDPDDAEREALESERDSLLSQLIQLGAQAAQAEADARLLQGGGQVLNPAEPPGQPVSPKPLRTGVLALMLGLMLGVGAAFLRDHFDDVLRDEDDAKRAGRGQPVLAWAPRCRDSWSTTSTRSPAPTPITRRPTTTGPRTARAMPARRPVSAAQAPVPRARPTRSASDGVLACRPGAVRRRGPLHGVRRSPRRHRCIVLRRRAMNPRMHARGLGNSCHE